MWVWDRSIGLWLWGVFQPNQEIKCLFAQLDRPTTNQSNVVCDKRESLRCRSDNGGSGGSLACFCVYWTKKCRMSPDVSGTRRAQAALLPGAICPPCGGPELRSGLRWVRGCAEVTGYQLPLASASCASPPHAPHAGPGMSRCFHAPLSHESTHLSSPAAGMFGDVVDYVTVDHLSIIV